MQIEPDTCQMSSDLEALCFNYATGFLPQYKKNVYSDLKRPLLTCVTEVLLPPTV